MGGIISFKHKGSFSNTDKFLRNVSKLDIASKLDAYAAEGVRALSAATPMDSGKTSSSWGYKIDINDYSITITWTNSNTNQGVPIAILIQYGHGTGTGGYVEGIDYINPALKPIIERMVESIWGEVIRA